MEWCETTGVQSILGISATDEIHMEDRNHGPAPAKPNNGIYNMANRLACKNYIYLNYVVPEQPKGRINLLKSIYIELEKHLSPIR